MITATQIRVGMILNLENELYKVLHTDHVTPGKGNAFVRAKIRRISDGIQTERRFRSSETVERAIIDTHNVQFLYQEGDHFHFMDAETFDQFHIEKENLENAIDYLIPNMELIVEMYDGKPIGVQLPKIVRLKIVQTEPYVKTATVTNQYKPAKLETGATLQVPGFIEEGEVVEIDTESGEYQGRARD